MSAPEMRHGRVLVPRRATPPWDDRLPGDGEWTPERLLAEYRRRYGHDPEEWPGKPNDSEGKGLKFNPNHDDRGRFSEGAGGGSAGGEAGAAVAERADGRGARIAGRTTPAPPTLAQPVDGTSTSLGDMTLAARAAVGTKTGTPGAVAEFSRAIAANGYETGALYDDVGTPLIEITQGAEGQVDWTDVAPRLSEAGLLIHNHPSGSTFSGADISLAIRNGITETRAVGLTGDFEYMEHRFRISRHPEAVLAAAEAHGVDTRWAVERYGGRTREAAGAVAAYVHDRVFVMARRRWQEESVSGEVRGGNAGAMRAEAQRAWMHAAMTGVAEQLGGEYTYSAGVGAYPRTGRAT